MFRGGGAKRIVGLLVVHGHQASTGAGGGVVQAVDFVTGSPQWKVFCTMERTWGPQIPGRYRQKGSLLPGSMPGPRESAYLLCEVQ